MNVGILGSGEVAKTLGAGFLKHGHSVMLGTRDVAKLTDWKAKYPSEIKGWDAHNGFHNVVLDNFTVAGEKVTPSNLAKFFSVNAYVWDLGFTAPRCNGAAAPGLPRGRRSGRPGTVPTPAATSAKPSLRDWCGR